MLWCVYDGSFLICGAAFSVLWWRFSFDNVSKSVSSIKLKFYQTKENILEIE